VERFPGAGLLPLLSSARETGRDLETASTQPLAADRDGDRVPLSCRKRGRNSLQRHSAARRIDRVVEMAELTRLFAKASGDVRIRSLFKGRGGWRQTDQNRGGRD